MKVVKILAVIVLGIATTISACGIFKKSDGKIIKGDYKVRKIENSNNNIAQLVCIVYDKHQNVPLSDAVVQINEIKKGGFTNKEGILELEIPEGKHRITVVNVGNTTIETAPINFKLNTKTEIYFRLGTAIIY